MIMLPLVLIICAITVKADNNNLNMENNNESVESRLKNEFGCTPVENWKLIKQTLRDEYVENVCIESSYQIYKSPSINNFPVVHSVIYDNQILFIDQSKNSLTILFGLWSFWQDPRIMVNNITHEEFIKLPPITNERAPLWFPFIVPEISNLKGLYQVHGSTLAHLSLNSGSSINNYMSKYIFAPNDTIVSAYFKRKLEISCEFDFSRYPFDDQYCPLTMKVITDVNLTIHELEVNRPNQKKFWDFDLTQGMFRKPYLNYFYGSHTTQFGFYNNMSRCIEAYIYQTYVPCIAIVTMSFSSFMIPVTAAPGRVAIIVTQFLTLTSIFIHQVVSTLCLVGALGFIINLI